MVISPSKKKKLLEDQNQIKNMENEILITNENKAPIETHCLIVLDKSGSMWGTVNSTVNGVNEQLQMLKRLETEFPDQKYFVTILAFSDVMQPIIKGVPAGEVKEFTTDDYKPNGGTALHDAIGFGITELNQDIQEKVVNGIATGMVVIITDGEENSSKEYDSESVKALITEVEKTGKWTVSFIGANQDAVLTARKFGINVSNVANYVSNELGTQALHKSVSSSYYTRAAKLSKGEDITMDFLASNDIKPEDEQK